MGYLYVNPDTVSNSSEELLGLAKSINSCRESVRSLATQLNKEPWYDVYSQLKSTDTGLEVVGSDLRILGNHLQRISEVYIFTAHRVATQDFSQLNPVKQEATSNDGGPFGFFNTIITGIQSAWSFWAEEWNNPDSVVYKTRKVISSVGTVIGSGIKIAGHLGIMVGTSGASTPISAVLLLKDIKSLVNGACDISLIIQDDYDQVGGDHMEDVLVYAGGAISDNLNLQNDVLENGIRLFDNGFDFTAGALGVWNGLDKLMDSGNIPISQIKDELYKDISWDSVLPKLSDNGSGHAAWKDAFPALSTLKDGIKVLNGAGKTYKKGESLLKDTN